MIDSFPTVDGIKAWLVLLPALILSLTWLKYRGLEYVIIHYRWLFVIFFLMPISLVYDAYFYIRNWIVFRLNSAPHKHDEKVKDVQRQVYTHTVISCYTCREPMMQWRQLRGAGGPSPPPQASQNNINFIGFTDSMFNMYTHIKL